MERRDDFAKFVKKLNDELAILRNGMKCVNQGAQIIANIASRPSFLEIQSGAFIDRGTVLDGGCGGGEVGGAGSTAGAVDWTANGADGATRKLKRSVKGNNAESAERVEQSQMRSATDEADALSRQE